MGTKLEDMFFENPTRIYFRFINFYFLSHISQHCLFPLNRQTLLVKQTQSKHEREKLQQSNRKSIKKGFSQQPS